MKPEDYGYVVKNNLCLFQKGPLSNWWGGFKGQNGGFTVRLIDLYFLYEPSLNGKIFGDFGKESHTYPVEFNCCEQWMMACKAILFNDNETFRKIMGETSPSKQKDLGRQVKNYNNDVWDRYKYDVVYRGLDYKFEQNYELQVFLCSFHPFTIFAEAASYDKIWGTGLDITDDRCLDINNWIGQNLLGRVITDVRRYYIDL